MPQFKIFVFMYVYLESTASALSQQKQNLGQVS